MKGMGRGMGQEMGRGMGRTATIAAGLAVGNRQPIGWTLAAPLARVSALRETSVLFAAVISTFVLKEGFAVWRFVSAGLIACGIGLTRYRS